jgi:signal transduction histidine kinase
MDRVQDAWAGGRTEEVRADLDAMMRVVWWAVGLTLLTGIAAHRARLIAMSEPAVLGLAAAIQLATIGTVWLTRRVAHPLRLYFAVHLWNILLVSIVVHYVGGIHFLAAPLLYALVVTNGGIVGYVPAHVLALTSWVAYGTVVMLEVTAVVPSFVEPGIPMTTVDPQAWPALIAVVAAVLHVSAGYAGRLAGVLRTRRHEVEAYRRRVEAEMSQRLEALDAAERARAETDALRRETSRFRTLVHIVTHDLKSPINAIYVTADLLLARDGGLAPQARDAIDRIRRMAETTEAKILDLMTLFRIVSTTEPRVRVDLNRLVRESLLALQGSIEEKGACVEVARLPVVWGEPQKLGCVVRNLLSNAVKYVHRGTGRIRISGAMVDGCTSLAVEDNGVGIPAAYHERIFDLFARVPEDPQTVDGQVVAGTGVGLALVRRIVESHHGTITVESAPERGSRFEIRLPNLSEPPRLVSIDDLRGGGARR